MAQPLRPFGLERYLAPREFRCQLQLCCSDSESWNMVELLDMLDDDTKSRWKDLRLGYTTTQGLPELREEIAKVHFTKFDADDMVLDAPGDAMFVAMTALLSAGDHVVCTLPGYQSLYETARSLGCELSFWTPVAGDEPGSLRFDPADLAKLVRPNTRLIVVNFPHNPTGFLPTHAEWETVVATARGCGAFLFADEMYRYIELDAADRLTPAADAYERGVSLGGLSKNVGMPGLRIGWVACRDKQALQRILEVKDFTTICCSAPSEIISLGVLRQWDTIMERQMGIIRTNVAALRAFAERWGGLVSLSIPRGGTITFPRITLPEGQTVEALSDQLLEEEGTFVLPGSAYQAPGFDDRFRLGFGRSNFPQALAALESFLDRHYAAHKTEASA